MRMPKGIPIGKNIIEDYFFLSYRLSKNVMTQIIKVIKSMTSEILIIIISFRVNFPRKKMLILLIPTKIEYHRNVIIV